MKKRKRIGIYIVILKDGRKLTSGEYYVEKIRDSEVRMIIDKRQKRWTPSEYRNYAYL